VQGYGFLLWQFIKRDIQTRYRGSVLGIGWALLGPLLMLGVFTLVFHGLFEMRWPVAASGVAQVDFALQVFVGLLLFSFLAEVCNRSPQLVVSQPNLVTKVVFPLPVLGVAAVASAGFQMLVGAILLMAFSLVLVGLQPSWLALPLVLLPLALTLLAASWFLSALGVYLRDVGQMMAMFTTLMMFVSAVFYPLSTVPERWQGLYLLNPLARTITDTRRLLFEGAWPAWGELGIYLLLSLLACVGAWAWFAWLRRGFADVL
jgi:lipopolysaccharide transport system permease protein